MPDESPRRGLAKAAGRRRAARLGAAVAIAAWVVLFVQQGRPSWSLVLAAAWFAWRGTRPLPDA